MIRSSAFNVDIAVHDHTATVHADNVHSAGV
ncbi:hypothetical protein N182_28080 [Sinorhizobium sp. GL2]|nr:hypothetical protein N182_28080 [Sinorhizobium sp. GL2]